MDFCALKLLRPSTLLCTSLVLLLFLFPESCLSGGKKMIPPVKHLFGVGIGYQKVVHYKPVLVFQKHRRTKPRPGWGGWGGSGYGSGWKGWKSYTPVVVQHHVHGKGRGHGGGGHGGGHHHGHRPKRKRRPHHGGRGWGWGWRRRRRPHGHGHGHGHREHSSTSGWKYESHHQDHHEPEYHPPVRPEKGEEGRGGGGHVRGEEGEYENVENVDGHGHSNRHRPSRHRHPHHQGNDGYATGYTYHGGEDHDDHDDIGGYESEIKENWNVNDEELSSPTTSVSPPSPPPIFPFTEAPTTDGGVTKIHKEFLRNHFKHYQELTTAKPTPFYPISHPHSQPPQSTPFRSHLMPPSHFTDLQSSEAENVYYDDPEVNLNMNSPEEGMEGDENLNEIKRNSNNMGNFAQASTPVSSTSFHVNPLTPMMMPMMPTMKAPPVPTLKIKPISSNSNNNMGRNDMNLNGKNDGVGEQFSEPGFFPSFDQFKRIKM